MTRSSGRATTARWKACSDRPTACSWTTRQSHSAPRDATAFERQTDGLAQFTPGTLCRVYADGKFLMLGRVDTLDKGGNGLFVHKNFR